jgi:hypothetical protein
MIPQVKFKVITLEEEFRIREKFREKIKDADTKGLHKFFDEFFMSDQEISEEYFEKQHALAEARNSFERIWAPKNTAFFEALNELYRPDCPNNDYEVLISLGKISPRHLQEKWFSKYVHTEPIKIPLEVGHEIIHFFHFHKWSQVFPDTDTKLYDTNSIEWHLSEIIAGPIANEKTISDVLGPYNFTTSDFYGAYKTKRIENQNMHSYFAETYQRLRKEKASMKDILIEFKKMALMHEEQLKSCYPIKFEDTSAKKN